MRMRMWEERLNTNQVQTSAGCRIHVCCSEPLSGLGLNSWHKEDIKQYLHKQIWTSGGAFTSWDVRKKYKAGTGARLPAPPWTRLWVVEIIVITSRGQCRARHFPGAGEAQGKLCKPSWAMVMGANASLCVFFLQGDLRVCFRRWCVNMRQ